MMKKILCIGHASYDITIPFDGYPIENTKNRVTYKLEWVVVQLQMLPIY